MMEINIRFLRSQQNRFYKFPLDSEEEDSEEQQRKWFMTQDLKNIVTKERSASNKVISLDSSQRIHSLDIQRNQWQKDRIVRGNFKEKQISFKQLRRNSLSEKIIKQSKSKLKLPELIIRKERQNLKTETKNPEYPEIQSIIGKKLATQASSVVHSHKIKGIQRYLKHIDHHNQKSQSNIKGKHKKIFLPEMN